MGVVMLREPFKFWWAPTVSLERLIVSGAVILVGRSMWLRRLRRRLLDRSKNAIFTCPTCIWRSVGGDPIGILQIFCVMKLESRSIVRRCLCDPLILFVQFYLRHPHVYPQVEKTTDCLSSVNKDYQKPCLPLISSRRASRSFGWCSFSVPPRVGGWVRLCG